MSPVSKDELRQATKEAIKEWLDEQFTTFGKWSLRVVITALLVVLFYLFVNARLQGFTDLPKVSVH